MHEALGSVMTHPCAIISVMATPDVRPGDVLVIRDDKFGSKLIRFRDWLLRRPKAERRHNHVAIVSHTDEAGTLWCIEGKPSSVGYVQAARYLESAELLHNGAQPKDDAQRSAIVKVAEEVNTRGGSYDWLAIGSLASQVARVQLLWRKHYLIKDWAEDEIPVHVICSSLADLCYEKVGLASPGGTVGTRFTTPSDWAGWIVRQGWATNT